MAFQKTQGSTIENELRVENRSRSLQFSLFNSSSSDRNVHQPVRLMPYNPAVITGPVMHICTQQTMEGI
jgi:hypothetical protein